MGFNSAFKGLMVLRIQKDARFEVLEVYAADQRLLGCDALFPGIPYLNMGYDSCCGLMIGKANHDRSCKNMAPLRM
jgi:hypothetical protein